MEEQHTTPLHPGAQHPPALQDDPPDVKVYVLIRTSTTRVADSDITTPWYQVSDIGANGMPDSIPEDPINHRYSTIQVRRLARQTEELWNGKIEYSKNANDTLTMLDYAHTSEEAEQHCNDAMKDLTKRCVCHAPWWFLRHVRCRFSWWNCALKRDGEAYVKHEHGEDVWYWFAIVEVKLSPMKTYAPDPQSDAGKERLVNIDDRLKMWRRKVKREEEKTEEDSEEEMERKLRMGIVEGGDVDDEEIMSRRASVHCGDLMVLWDVMKDAIVITFKYSATIRRGIAVMRRGSVLDYAFDINMVKSLVSLSTNLFRRTGDGSRESTMGLESLKGQTTPRLVTLPSYMLVIERESSWRYDGFFPNRREGDDVVGLPGKHIYFASPRRPPKFRFGRKCENEMIDILEVGEERDTPAQIIDSVQYDKSLIIRGLLIGTIDWSSDPVPAGVIPRRAFERFGWDFSVSTKNSHNMPDHLGQTLVIGRAPDNGELPPYYRRACWSYLTEHSLNGNLYTTRFLDDEEFNGQESPAQEYLRRVLNATFNRVCLTGTSPSVCKDKLYGLGPPKTRIGDIIAVLYGCSVPVILHPHPPY
ncbi:hypothetical protein EK21DRAFT_88634 [Setomelanomma holmii]|uniref:Uncharacterized protein n=1 Tax=Setomelanomma holmii TaxID=210430 RepID=A0A9P4H9E5_9PLEO|nr:hypothetical protein EK21DRAFT_88634 [Setomelanomma holmii]